jgi:LysR family glycine cleavage system transcriptional activator
MVRVAPLCSPDTARAAAGQSLAQFLSQQELLHIKLEGRSRDLLWSSYARQCGLDIDTGEGLAFDTAIAAAQYAMGGAGVTLADIDMFATEIAEGRLVMPFDAVIEEGYGYCLKLHADDLSDPAISIFRSWLTGRFVEMRTVRNQGAQG